MTLREIGKKTTFLPKVFDLHFHIEERNENYHVHSNIHISSVLIVITDNYWHGLMFLYLLKIIK